MSPAGFSAGDRTMISPMIDVRDASTGGSTPSGSAAAASFSATVCRARCTSAPQSKSSQMTATPTAPAARRTPR